MPDDALWAAYARTVLLVGRKPRIKVDLSRPLSDDLRHLLTNLGLGATFAIVTPCDPRGARAHPWINWARYLHARVLLRSRNLTFVPARGESPDSTHGEPGFAIAMSREAAMALARDLQQLAIYWFDGDEFWIYGALAPRTPQRLP